MKPNVDRNVFGLCAVVTSETSGIGCATLKQVGSVIRADLTWDDWFGAGTRAWGVGMLDRDELRRATPIEIGARTA